MTIKVSRIPNGALVITDKRRDTKSALVGVWIRGQGARFDPIEGTYHLIEHMRHRRTKNRTSYGVARDIEAKGGTLDATTEREQIDHFVQGLPTEINNYIEVIADMILNPVFDPDELRREMRTILSESQSDIDDPRTGIFRHLFRQIYRGQKFGGSILGLTEELENMTPRQLGYYSRRGLAGSNLVFVGVGSVNHTQFHDAVEQYFGHLAASARCRPGKAEFHSSFFGQIKNYEQTHMAIGLPGPKDYADDFYAAQCLATMIGEATSMTSRLYQEARSNRGLLYTPDTDHIGYSDTGLLVIDASTDPRKVRELISLIGKEVCGLRDNMQQTKFECARTKRIGDLAGCHDSLPEWAYHLGAKGLTINRKLSCEEIQFELSYEAIEQRYRSLAREDVQTYAEQICAQAPAAVALGLQKRNPLQYSEILEPFGHEGPHEVIHRQKINGTFVQELAA